jgi:hypothetical protein
VRRVPRAEVAVVDPQKIVEYLLSPDHRRGANTARFFTSFGFDRSAPDTLATALRRHIVENDVAGVRQTSHGLAYEVAGPLMTPDQRAPSLRSVWLCGADGVPRLITAYPNR